MRFESIPDAILLAYLMPPLLYATCKRFRDLVPPSFRTYADTHQFEIKRAKVRLNLDWLRLTRQLETAARENRGGEEYVARFEHPWYLPILKDPDVHARFRETPVEMMAKDLVVARDEEGLKWLLRFNKYVRHTDLREIATPEIEQRLNEISRRTWPGLNNEVTLDAHEWNLDWAGKTGKFTKTYKVWLKDTPCSFAAFELTVGDEPGKRRLLRVE